MTGAIAPARRSRLNIDGNTICFSQLKNVTTREIISDGDNLICGDPDPDILDYDKGRFIISFSVVLRPTWPIFEAVLPLLGINDLGSDTFELGADDDVTSFDVDIDHRSAMHTITGCYTAGWKLRGQKGGSPLQFEWDIVGTAEAEDVTANFAVAKLTRGPQFAFTNTTLSVTAANKSIDRFLLQVNNNLIIEHENTDNLTGVTIGQRQGILAASIPYTLAEKDMYWSLRDDEDGEAAVLVNVNSDKTMTCTVPTGLAVTRGHSFMSKADQIRTPLTMILTRSDNAGTRVAPLTMAFT